MFAQGYSSYSNWLPPGLTSEDTPLSEIRAMQQAQEELCEMLGISPEDLRGPAIETRHKRSRSHSAAMQSPRSPRSFASRTKSEIYTPNTSASDSFRIHHRSRTIDDVSGCSPRM